MSIVLVIAVVLAGAVVLPFVFVLGGALVGRLLGWALATAWHLAGGDDGD